MNYFSWTLFLVSATITERAITIRCTTKIVHIIWATISQFDVCWTMTTAWFPVETHLSGDLTVCYCGVSTIQPAGCISTTSEFRWTWSWHSFAGGPFETKPTRSDSIVTIRIVQISFIRNLSVRIIKNFVLLTFWYRKKENNTYKHKN